MLNAEEISAHIEIRQVVMRFVRGLDRVDERLMTSAFHPDATHRHGPFHMQKEGLAADFIREYITSKSDPGPAGQHHITNQYIELRGRDDADVESYFIALVPHLEDGNQRTGLLAGRYLDRFQRRGGEWRIAARVDVVSDFTRRDMLGEPWATTNATNGYTEGTRGLTDPSYRFFCSGLRALDDGGVER